MNPMDNNSNNQILDKISPIFKNNYLKNLNQKTTPKKASPPTEEITPQVHSTIHKVILLYIPPNYYYINFFIII